ncbi:hypothetical protein SPONN_803 [uncultured Candidatus Thioglobus sp.]|nr:hypothetical protein SPONN_803 [uncultured Candidatus Thioglobus sp.]
MSLRKRDEGAEKQEDAACRDIIQLATEAARAGLITQDVLDYLTSLQVSILKRRCLLMHLYNTINSDEQLFIRMVKVFVGFESRLMMPPESGTYNDCLLGTGDIPDLAECLVPYAYRWRSIGTALRFKPQELDNIQACQNLLTNSPGSYLMRLLEDWVLQRYTDTLRPTLNSLEIALNSRLVGLGNLAQELQPLIARRKNHTQVLPCYVASVNVDIQDYPHVTSHNRMDIIEAEENAPFIIKTQVPSDQALAKYQWLINDEQISDTESAVHTGNMATLCIPKADADMDGSRYSCQITNGTGTYKTRSIILRVKCPLDSFAHTLSNMHMYAEQMPKDTWPPVSASQHINLALIKQEHVNYHAQYARLTIRGDMDDILQNKEMIEYDDILKSLKSKDVLLIEGRPGCGKTTFVHKITHDWAKKRNAVIRLVLLVSLRVLNKLNKPHLDLQDILNLFPFKNAEVTKQLLEERNGKNVCFIFDGLEEFSPPDGKNSVVFNIIYKNYLTESAIIVASRPAATAELRNRANKVIEVLGFPNEQILKYFDCYPFSDSSKAKDLKVYLSSHPNILHMCYLPIHAAMVGFLFEVTGKVPTTETEIYTHFTRFTILRSLSKNRAISDIDIQNLSEKDEKLFSQICKLALEMTISNKQVLRQDEAESYFLSSKHGDISLGLITVDRTADLYGFKDIYTFLHLTFQEYLAAKYISTLSGEEQLKLIEEHGDKNHMLVVWKFYCGLVEFTSENKKFKLILDKTPQNILFHTQCAYESQQSLSCTQLSSSFAFSNKYLTIPDCTAIGYALGKSVSATELSIVKCNLSDEAVNALLLQLNGNHHSLQSLRFHLMEYDDSRHLNHLLFNLPSLRKLSINFKRVSISHQALADHLRLCTNIEEVDFSDNMLHDTSAIVLVTGLSCDKLERINIQRNRICNSHAIADICRKSANLIYLDISENILGDSGAKTLASGLMSCRKFERIRICTNGISVKGALDIFTSIRQRNLKTNSKDFTSGNEVDIIQFLYCLQHCTNLQSLEIDYNMTLLPLLSKEWKSLKELKIHLDVPCGLGKVMTTPIAHYIRDHFHELRTILLENFSMSDEKAENLAEGLSRCPKLQVLDLSCSSQLQTAGIKAIAASLIYCTTLEQLHLNNCGIDREGATALSLSLNYYPNLRILGLRSNNIDSVGALALVDQLKCSTRLESWTSTTTRSITKKVKTSSPS